MSMKYWLEKATFDTGDIAAGSGLLSPAQAKEFLRVAIAQSVLVNQCRIETSDSPKFEVPRIAFSSRVLKKGTEATRLTDGDRVQPTPGLCSLSTYLYRGEVYVSDEMFEDNIEREGLADTLMTMIAEATGRDIEEYGLLNNLTRISGDAGYAAELDVFEGIVKAVVGQSDIATTGIVIPVAQCITTAAAYTSFDALFAALLELIPSQYRRDMGSLRIYTSYKLRDRYRASLAARGTQLGDKAMTDDLALTYGGVPVVGIPTMTGIYGINTAGLGGTSLANYDNIAFCGNPKAIVWGFHRKVRVERFRDPRDGATSFLPSVRFDVQVADPTGWSSAKVITAL